MVSKIVSLEKNFSIGKAAGIVGALTLLSRIIGLVRDRLFASHFGAGDVLDAYYAAFRIPDFVFNLLVLGTLSVAFIPVFTELFLEDKKRAYKTANTVLNLAFLIMGGICLLLLVNARPLTQLLVPGFSGEKLEHTILLTRIFLVSPVIFTLSNVFTSILNAQKKFIVVGAAPILYNLGIIGGLMFLYPRFGITGLGFGVVIGACMHLLIQIPEAVRYGYHWQPVVDTDDESFKRIRRLFIPRIFGVDISQVSLLIGSMVGSFLASGSIAVLSLASNLQAVPLGVFAVSSAVAAFPVLSEYFARKDDRGYLDALSDTMVQILFFIIPSTILLLLFRAYIVRLAFGAGRFDWEATIATFNTLGIFAFSLFSQALTPLFSRAFYSRQTTVTPVVVNFFTMGINAALAYVLGVRFGIMGVAAGFSIASIFNALTLFVLLRRRMARKGERKELLEAFDTKLVQAVTKIVVSSAVMGMVGFLALRVADVFVDNRTGVGLLIQAGFSGAIAVAAYLAVSSVFDIPQAKSLVRQVQKLWK